MKRPHTLPPPVSRLKSPLAWFAANPVAANLLMLLILIGGATSLWEIDKEVMPRLSGGMILLTAPYPGATPAQVEEAVCIPIEEAIYDLPGITHLYSEATEGQCQIIVSVPPEHDLRELLSTLRTRTQALSSLPKAVGRIEIREPAGTSEAINVVLYGPSDELTLKRLGERVRNDLLSIPGVVRLVDTVKTSYEIALEVSTERLHQHELTLREVVEAVRRTALDLPGGAIKTPTGELMLRAKGEFQDARALADLVLRANPDGTHLRLGEVALIREGLAEQGSEHRFDGYPAVGWRIYARHDVVEVAHRVAAYVTERSPRLPEGIQLATRGDNSRLFVERVNTLLEDGLIGSVLVVGVLMAFLRTRVAFWAGVGIVISVFGTLWWMPALGITLNQLSLFGFLLALGILADDAIIIGEEIHTRQRQGLRGLSGAIRGVQEVATPVILTVVIAGVAFLPGLFLPGWAGQLLRPLCLVILLTLVFSLVEALLILPAHLAEDVPQERTPSRLERLRAVLNQGLEGFIMHLYRPSLRRVLQWRYLTLAGFGAAMVITGALVAGGFVRLSLLADVAQDTFGVELTLPPGAPSTETRALAERVERALFELEGAWERGQPAGTPRIVAHLDTYLGERESSFWVELSPEARERIAVDELVREWRKRIGDIGRAKLDFLGREGAAPYDIKIGLSAPDPTLLMQAAEVLKRRLAAYPGVYDVGDSYEAGKPEVRLTLTPEAKHLGLPLKDLADQVHQGFLGEEAVHVLRGREEVKVVVRYPLGERQSLDHLRAIPVRLPKGGEAPLGALAEVSFAPGYARLTREDRRRVLRVQARVDPQQANVNTLYRDLEGRYFQSLEERFPTLQIGSREEEGALAQAFLHHTLLALTLIYALIAIPFRSYGQPLLFMVAIPVAWMGAVLAHGVLALPLSAESLMGMVAASGVVVNDSLVLLDYIYRRRASSEPLQVRITEACAARFRPILLTFLTNFAGFFPILLDTSEQAQFLVPMVVALAFGLLFGMVATLVAVPAGYAALDDIQGRVGGRLKPAQPTEPGEGSHRRQFKG